MILSKNSGLAKNPKAAGRGAELTATFALTEGDEIRVIVGQKGSDYPGKDYFGGSGGTFVVKYRVIQDNIFIKKPMFFQNFVNHLICQSFDFLSSGLGS